MKLHTKQRGTDPGIKEIKRASTSTTMVLPYKDRGAMAEKDQPEFPRKQLLILGMLVSAKSI